MIHKIFIDEETERNALAILMSGTKQGENLALQLQPEYFSNSLRAKAFISIRELMEEGRPVDGTQVIFQMKREGRISEIKDALQVIVEETNSMPAIFQLDKWYHYAATLKQLYVHRQCEKAVEQYNYQLNEADPYTAGLALIEAIDELSKSSESIDVQVAGKIAYEVSERIRLTLNGQRQESFTPTGIAHLDKIISGFYPKQYITIAARPAQGKSALALQIALNMALQKQSIGYITLEMSKEEQVNRCLANIAKVGTRSVKNPRYLQGDELMRIQESATKMSALQMYFIDDAQMTISDIAAKVKEMKKKSAIKGVFIDMIQLIKPERYDQAKPKTEQLTNISKALKALAKKEDIWICNVAAMNRDSEKQNRKPKVSDIRETGQIESDSDLVLMLYRPNYDPDQPPTDNAPEDIDLIIGKNRDGAQGTIMLTAEFQYSRFEQVQREQPVYTPSYKKAFNQAPF